MPSSPFPGPALPAADQIMPFPGEELGSTVCGDRISQELSSCYTNSYMLCSSDKVWTWEEEDRRQNDWGCWKLYTTRQCGDMEVGKPFVLLLQGFLELPLNHLLEHLEKKYQFP